MRISWPAISSRRFFSLALRDCQAPPPRLVEHGFRPIRAVARQKLDVLDRQIEPAVAGIVDFQAVMRRAGGLDGLQPDEAADAVIGVDDDVAGRQRRRLGDEVGGLLALLGAAHQAVAEDVLLGDDDEAVGLEAGLERQHGERPPAPASSFSTSASVATGFTLPSWCSARIWARRSSEPSVQPATTTRRLAARTAAMCLTAASNTLALGSARSSAKLWPAREPA